MAVGGYSWSDDTFNVVSGYDPNTWSRWFVIRMTFDDAGVLREIQSVEPAVQVPPKLLEEKIALLKTAPPNTRIDGVGWRRGENIFYLRIYEGDLYLGEMK